MDFSAYGYWGMLLTGFLAGSVFPFSSEAVMLGLLATPGIEPWTLVAYGTVGNVLGSMFNYCVGRLGRPEWIERWLKIKPEKMERARRFMAGRGAWMGFLPSCPCWVVPSPSPSASCVPTFLSRSSA